MSAATPPRSLAPSEVDPHRAITLAPHHGGSIRSKLVLCVAMVFFAFFAIHLAVQQLHIRPSLAEFHAGQMSAADLDLSLHQAHRSFVLAALGVMLALAVALWRVVIRPIEAMRRHVEQIAEQDWVADSDQQSAQDELENLAEAFDLLTTRIGQTQQELSETSRAAGMSQVAGTVIHNIGNVLTNVNSLLDSTRDKSAGLRLAPLQTLADRLENSPKHDELWEAAPAYLKELAASLIADRDELTDMLDTLRGNVHHIDDVIRDQRRHTEVSTPTQPFVVGQLIEDAIACSQARLNQDRVGVSLCGDLQTVIRSDASLLLQVLINVLANSRSALSTIDDRPRRIEISVTAGDDVKITIRDNGCGMDQATHRRIFDAHFTTREEGSGLGLHFCANSISRLGGEIRADSPGLDQGSTLLIRLPVDPDRRRSHAGEVAGASVDHEIAETESAERHEMFDLVNS